MIFMFLFLIIPAYNEEQRIKRTLRDYLKYFKNNFKILVVLNGCTDNTLAVVKDVQNHYPQNLDSLDIKEMIGKGGAIRKGFKRAQGDIVGFIDADGSTSPLEFEKLIKAIDHFSGAIASRWIAGAKVLKRESFLRKIASRIFLILVRLLFRMPYQDTQCGAKVFRKEVIDSILPELRINNMAFDVELLYLIKRRGYQLKEVPTVWVDKSTSAMLGSPLRFLKTSWEMFWGLIFLRLRYIFR